MNSSLDTRHPSLSQAWLEADGLGGFASGTVSGIRTRRYHALLLTATTPPTGRERADMLPRKSRRKESPAPEFKTELAVAV